MRRLEFSLTSSAQANQNRLMLDFDYLAEHVGVEGETTSVSPL